MTTSQKLLTIPAFCLSLTLLGCNSMPTNNSGLANIINHKTGIEHTNSQYANERHLTVANQNLPVSETSARLLTNQAGNAPELVADIYDGNAEKPVAGYKIMIINRTSSLAAEGRVRDGKVTDNRMIHRGSKALIGIPVSNGKPQLDKAALLDLDIIYDDPSKPLAEGESVKPRGKKLTKKGVQVTNKSIKVKSLTLPNYASGENAGGGINFEASALVDGQVAKTGANSAFQIFYTATPDNARGF